ncbi:Hypothetical protein CINCED_3A022662 [Cinara cedri]|nr:Hypothetical protein CINCED_3A022662 [Cinara cedri]
MLILWFGHVSLEILFKLIQSRKIKNIVIKTIKSMEKSSLLIQKMYKFLSDCDKLYNIHNSCNDTSKDKNSNIYLYLLMPELKSLLLTELQDLINCLVYNISEVQTFFPLKDSVKNIIYLYLTDCKIDIENTSLENINRAKYTYYLLQSEFLKQLTLCLNPVLWTPKSYSELNNLIKFIGELEKVYSNLYNILSEEYNIYSLFKHSNNLKNIHLNNNSNFDFKSKVYSIRQVLQNMMIHLRVMEDLIEMPSNYCNDSINASVSILVKESTVFNELISTFQIDILKANKEKKNEIILSNNAINVTKNNSLEENNDPIKFVCDELFFGVSEKISEETNDTFFGEEIFDKSNNHNLILELKVALKEKQMEWKQREEKLQKEHIQLNDLSDEENFHENHFVNNQSINSIRKVALDMEPDNSFSMQLPSENLANEIASIASKWNTEIESFGDDSDSDV